MTSIPFASVGFAAVAISLIISFGTWEVRIYNEFDSIFLASGSPTTGTLIRGIVLATFPFISPIWASLHLTAAEAFPTPIR